MIFEAAPFSELLGRAITFIILKANVFLKRWEISYKV